MGSEPQFEVVCVFRGKNHIYCLCPHKEPLGQCLVLLLGKGGCFTSLPRAALSVRGAELRQSPGTCVAEDTVIPVNFIFLSTLSSCGTWSRLLFIQQGEIIFCFCSLVLQSLLFFFCKLAKMSLIELWGPQDLICIQAEESHRQSSPSDTRRSYLHPERASASLTFVIVNT